MTDDYEYPDEYFTEQLDKDAQDSLREYYESKLESLVKLGGAEQTSYLYEYFKEANEKLAKLISGESRKDEK